MNSRELRSLEEVVSKLRGYANQSGAASAQFYAVGAHTPSLAEEERASVLNRAADLLSSSREAAAPTSSPKGLERWKLPELPTPKYSGGWTAEEMRSYALSAIRRSVEEALGAAASPLEVNGTPVAKFIAQLRDDALSIRENIAARPNLDQTDQATFNDMAYTQAMFDMAANTLETLTSSDTKWSGSHDL